MRHSERYIKYKTNKAGCEEGSIERVSKSAEARAVKGARGNALPGGGDSVTLKAGGETELAGGPGKCGFGRQVARMRQHATLDRVCCDPA